MRAIVLLTLLAFLAPARAADYPAVPPSKDPASLGLGVQRTMTLLATSTPEHRNKVRVLFYGQSITEQTWSKFVADDLRKRFPSADLEIENRAIGGFASQLLIRPAEHDVYPFYPDLVIFHVYGSHTDYEQIIKNIRSRTTAEVLMQRDHVTKWPAEKPDEKGDKGLWWDHMMNNVFLPKIAKTYGCGLADVRSGWLAYLKANNLEPKDLLKDGVHLNDHGNFVMAELVKQNLVHRPELPADAWKDLAKTVQVGTDVQWKDGRLTLDFEGNRVDLIAAADALADAAPIQVVIDGKKPSEFDGGYRITRPQPGPWSPLALIRVDHDKPLVIEDWTMKITAVEKDAAGKDVWQYTVRGSVTGDDGAGSSATLFTSPSGRVKIAPTGWYRAGAKLPVGYEIKWKVLPTHADTFAAPKAADASHERAVTIAQGLPNEKHTLILTAAAGTTPGVKFIRIYRPPAK